MDIFTKDKRSWIMGRIRSRNTKPEIIVRSILHRMGFRFSLKRRDLPGIPDIVLPRHRTVVFVHGCFWHRHKNCRTATFPKSKVEFWKDKFDKNVRRDKKNECELRRLGWRIIVIWECQVMKNPAKIAKRLSEKMENLHRKVKTRHAQSARPKNHLKKAQKIISYQIPGKKELLRIAEKKADYAREK